MINQLDFIETEINLLINETKKKFPNMKDVIKFLLFLQL